MATNSPTSLAPNFGRHIMNLVHAHFGDVTICYQTFPDLGFVITPLAQAGVPDGWHSVGQLTAQERILASAVGNWQRSLDASEIALLAQERSRGQNLTVIGELLVIADTLNDMPILRLIPNRR